MERELVGVTDCTWLGHDQASEVPVAGQESVAMLFALRTTMAALTAVMAMLGAYSDAIAQLGGTAPLKLEAKIPLGDVRGRIDHMAIDLKRKRLFVAELGNDSVGIVDLTIGKSIQRIAGLKEPQGVGYEPSTDTLFVANAGDGSVRLFEGATYTARGQITLGSDADNIRIEAAANRVFVGYGNGALAVIDAATRNKVGDVALKGHPEGFQIDPNTGHVFINVPDARGIAVVDGVSQKQIGNWTLADRRANFPMALDPAGRRVLVIFRAPAKLGAFSMTEGKLISTTETCDDADDLFIDIKRSRVYVSCGGGFLDILEMKGAAFRRIARIPTASGARTSLFSPELDRLLVAVRASAEEPAAVWVFRPQP